MQTSNAVAFNPIVDIYHNQLEASRQMADVIFSGTQRIDRVVLDAAHRAFTEQLRFAQALAAARDPKGLASLQSSMMNRPESAMDYQKEIMRVMAEIQNEIGRSLQVYIEQISQRTAGSARRQTEAVQDQTSDAMLNPVTGMMSVWESAFREVASLANKNMAVARSTFESAANAAGTAAANAAQAAAGVVDEVEDAMDERKGSRKK